MEKVERGKERRKKGNEWRTEEGMEGEMVDRWMRWIGMGGGERRGRKEAGGGREKDERKKKEPHPSSLKKIHGRFFTEGPEEK